MPLARRANLAFTHGEGPYLYGYDGKKYLDFLAGIAVCSLGHSHPQLVAAMREQSGKVWHYSNHFRIPEQERLAERLVEATGMEQAYFCNSGAEANESAFKLTRKYFDDIGQPEKFRIITFEQAFHGRTLATVTATGQEKYLKGFYPKVDGFDKVAYGNMNELRAAITPETAAIMIEPVQGEGGLRVASDEWLQALRKTCDEFGLLLIYDQVQCGVGRTGKFCSHHWSGVKPDVLTFAKGIAGGYPMGVCLSTKKAATGMTPGSHGTTFGGSPMACALANAALDVLLAPGFMENVQQRGQQLREGLEKLAQQYPNIVIEPRGRGLLAGFQLKSNIVNTDFVPQLREHGLLSTVAGENCIRLVPPLIITANHVDEALAIIEKTCRDFKPAA
ncbi:MAG: aspartate aminotransferase family protein [Alphaproteobacteria bacterium]|nr:MAG: aspartate aminotransferase family protein [Alphaproteobacteria bacterium]